MKVISIIITIIFGITALSNSRFRIFLSITLSLITTITLLKLRFPNSTIWKSIYVYPDQALTNMFRPEIFQAGLLYFFSCYLLFYFLVRYIFTYITIKFMRKITSILVPQKVNIENIIKKSKIVKVGKNVSHSLIDLFKIDGGKMIDKYDGFTSNDFERMASYNSTVALHLIFCEYLLLKIGLLNLAWFLGMGLILILFIFEIFFVHLFRTNTFNSIINEIANNEHN